ncbi:uncharacterized protein ASCRUDRAFT_74459, partial [Ascoidea rubescens DSM 1968]
MPPHFFNSSMYSSDDDYDDYDTRNRDRNRDRNRNRNIFPGSFDNMNYGYYSDSHSDYSTESNLQQNYNSFIQKYFYVNPIDTSDDSNDTDSERIIKQKKPQKVHYDPVRVSVYDDDSNQTFQFPYEAVKTWPTFQLAIQAAFPNYSSQIKKVQLDLIDLDDNTAFIPSLFDCFIKPGAKISVKFKFPLKPGNELSLTEQLQKQINLLQLQNAAQSKQQKQSRKSKPLFSFSKSKKNQLHTKKV